MNGIAKEPQNLFALLMLGDDPLAELVDARRRDAGKRFAFCRRLGETLRAARVRKSMTVDELALDSGTSPRLLELIEQGVLDASWIADETIESLAESLELDSDALYESPAAEDSARWAVLAARFREWITGRVEILTPEPLPTRGPLGEPPVPERMFGPGIWLGPVEGQTDAVVLQVYESAIGDLAHAPLLVVVQRADGTILAEHVFERVDGVARVELAADARAATRDDVVVVLAQKPDEA